MRRGETARVWREVNTHGDAYAAFQRWVDVIAKKVRGFWQQARPLAISQTQTALAECGTDLWHDIMPQSIMAHSTCECSACPA